MNKKLCLTALLGVGLASVSPLWAGSFTADFNDGLAPAGTTLFGDANAGVIETTGGVGGTGCLKLTKAVNGVQGSMIIDDLDAGALVNSFTANFKLRIGGGSSTPADGCSICFGSDVGGGFGEGGSGSGLRVGIDIYNNPDDAPAMKIFWGGVQVATTGIRPIADIVTGSDFVDMTIRINPTGTLDVIYKGNPVFTNLAIGFTPISGGKFGFGGRTGGLNTNQFVDDISITTTPGDYLLPAVRRAPRSQRIIAGYTSTMDVLGNDPGNTTYQWEKKGPADGAFTPIDGATDATFTTGTLTLADAGTQYRVVLTNPGAATATSDPATIDVILLPHQTPNTVSYNFDDGLTPSGTNNYGNAAPLANGGFGDSGQMELTQDVGGQAGTWTVSDLNSGLPVESIDVAFRLLMTPSSNNPADGFGFHWAPDLPASGFPNAEEPVGHGLSVGFDVYDNGGGEAPAVDVFWLGTRIGGLKIPRTALNTQSAYADVQIRLSSLGKVDVSFNGEVVAYQLQIPSWTAFSGASYGFSARTGGAFQRHAIDDVQIKSVAYSGPIGFVTNPSNALALPGRTATFSVVSNDPSRTNYQWQVSVGGGAFTDIGGANSQTYTTPALTMAENGNQYRAHLTSTGNGSTADSTAATLTVYNLTGPTAPKIFDKFDNLSDVDNQGTAPTTVQTLSGDYSFAGTAGTGYLILTAAENGKFGSLVIDDFNGGNAVGGFTASVKAQLVGADPADGWSFSWGTGIALTQGNGGLEAGLGNDLRVGFYTYAGSGRSVRVNFRGTQIANVPVPIELLQAPVDTFKEVLIRVTPATASTTATLDVAYDGTLLVQNLALTGLQGIAGGRFAIAARTGGLNELHAYDDLAISTSLYVGPITLVNQPPAALTIVNDTPVTLTVESSNPPVSGYQWQRSAPGGGAFVDIPGANSATYTTPNLPLADSGVRYQVVVTGSTNVVTSNPTTVTIVSPGLPASFERIIDFNDGLVPADAVVFGSAVVTSNAGVDDTGMLQLTTAVNGLQGSMALLDQDAGAPVTGFVTKFLVRIGNGTDPPADGASFVWSPEPITGGFGEGGTGTGLIISFDIYDNDDGNPNNATGEAPAIEALWKGETLGNVRVPRALLESGSEFREIIVRVNPDGTLDIIFGTQVIYWHMPLPGYAPIANASFGWGGRTGGLNAEQDIDSIQLTTFTANQPTLVLATVGNNIVITFDGVLESSGNLTDWTPMPGQTSPLTLPISGLTGHTFYRARK